MFPTLLDPIGTSLITLTLLLYAVLSNLLVLFSGTAISIVLSPIGTHSPYLSDSHPHSLLSAIDLSLTYLLLFLVPSHCPFPLTLFSACPVPFPAALHGGGGPSTSHLPFPLLAGDPSSTSKQCSGV